MGKFGHKVQIDLNPLAYNICLLGESGIGKSTLAKESCQKLVSQKKWVGQYPQLKGHGGLIEVVITWRKSGKILKDMRAFIKLVIWGK